MIPNVKEETYILQKNRKKVILLEKELSTDVLVKIHRKIPVMESYYTEVTGLTQQDFVQVSEIKKIFHTLGFKQI